MKNRSQRRAERFNRAGEKPTSVTGTKVCGSFVPLAAAVAQTSDGWKVLAYEVAMKGSDVALSKRDFEQCVANFERYPCAPVTIEHADTDFNPFSTPPKEWREPNGHIEGLRVGTMTRGDRVVATLEGKPSYLEPTATDVKAGKWRFGSITIIQGAVDEETGAEIGSMLWSWSLTAHPRLTGLTALPSLAASRRPPPGEPTEAGYLWLPENDVGFVDAMVPHHQMAISMAQHVVERGSADAVKALAARIITAQTAEIETMRAARKELTGSGEPAWPEGPEDDMLEVLARLDGAALDGMFLDAMVPHHASSIAIADAAIPHLDRADLRGLAKSIVAAQAAEIAEMLALRGSPADGAAMGRHANNVTPAAAIDPATMSRTTPQESSMKKFSIILAALGLAAAASEEDAEKRVTAAAQLGVDALKALGLPPTATAAELAAKVSEISSAAAKVPGLTAEVTTFRAERDARAKADREAYIADLIAARPELAPVKASLAFHAEQDWAGFSAAHPRPTREQLATATAEAAQRAQDGARTAGVTVAASANPATKDAPKPPAQATNLRAEIAAVLDEYGIEPDAMTVTDAIAKGHTATTLRAALAGAAA